MGWFSKTVVVIMGVCFLISLGLPALILASAFCTFVVAPLLVFFSIFGNNGG